MVESCHVLFCTTTAVCKRSFGWTSCRLHNNSSSCNVGINRSFTINTPRPARITGAACCHFLNSFHQLTINKGCAHARTRYHREFSHSNILPSITVSAPAQDSDILPRSLLRRQPKNDEVRSFTAQVSSPDHQRWLGQNPSCAPRSHYHGTLRHVSRRQPTTPTSYA